jgi:hypothetical protein
LEREEDVRLVYMVFSGPTWVEDLRPTPRRAGCAKMCQYANMSGTLLEWRCRSIGVRMLVHVKPLLILWRTQVRQSMLVQSIKVHSRGILSGSCSVLYLYCWNVPNLKMSKEHHYHSEKPDADLVLNFHNVTLPIWPSGRVHLYLV